jgi:F0F1-type ATP synthase membrane subunit c/vacuolar-type H+-ATPase subunit K
VVEEDVVGSGEAGEAGKQAAADQASTSTIFPFIFNTLSSTFPMYCLVCVLIIFNSIFQVTYMCFSVSCFYFLSL